MRLWSLIVLISISFNLVAQEDVGVIWMGFEHEWTYNHRLNRLGDYVSQPEFDGFDHPVKHYHTGATGLGWDEALFTSYYTVVKTDDVGVQSGQLDLKLENREGQRATVKRKLTIPLQSNMENKDQIVAILNGFDLMAEDGADKLKMLNIDLSDPIYNADKTEASLTVEVGFIADCSSLECNRFRQQYSYSIKVHYLLIAGNKNEFFGTEKSFLKSYEWDKHDTFEDGLVDETVIGYPGFKHATIGFKSLMINMDRDHWLVDWHTSIHPQWYDYGSGKLDFSLDLFLKQWKKPRESPFRLQSRFSKRKDGWAYLGGSVMLLQFKDACLENRSRFGTVQWKGKNVEVNNNSMNVERFRVNEKCDD